MTKYKAPVDAIDAKIDAAATKRTEICQRMANGELELMPELLEISLLFSSLVRERKEICSKYFNS